MSDDMEFPAPGEIVLSTVVKIIDQGAYVTLDEYNNIQGFLHTQEIASGWIKAINRYVKKGEKKVLRVKKVNPSRGDIDLSLKQVSNDQRKKKLREVKRYEKGQTLLSGVAERASLSEDQVGALETKLYEKFDTIYDAFLNVAQQGTDVLNGTNISEDIVDAIQDVCSKIKLPTVEIRGVMELTCNKPDGVVKIKDILTSLDERYAGSNITYLGAPKYRVAITAGDFKFAEKMLKPILVEIQKGIEKNGGTFSFTREESRKNRED
ncbi:MAG: translation initiation factor IF-2 subunit alpha [Cenarchaeum sp. SB0661_bin_35]|nr:translation initiation factor IF-2 subunit alpha [Cenarchaeum sp. SB0667_bin_13]MXZ93709.1 translation initiation factor IF-2 subunit alpha [Cenarchaeum sp. SB0666_bin_15]MYB47271.1 translation initiation factor IF-2 subunit alpha [Cenarchaeum sp. SB0662_bin_33]MYC79916.1 translation initiation factor IF-2 subunit alpha [Cenarchaeum sp. SB0661_bin_35]MYD59100.1 translation initiation factor IF-2 subunit alpha [Cenarchaeum sp. SB0678_bin_8]MYI51608.1 translation initiation factor IF-2 subuni